jgi:hypothetical protein
MQYRTGTEYTPEPTGAEGRVRHISISALCCWRDRDKMQSQVFRPGFIRYLLRSGRVRPSSVSAFRSPTYPRTRAMCAAPHPVESSQQNVQLPALDAPHAAIAQAGGASKPKKEKKAAAGSGFPLEVRSVCQQFWTHT